MIETTEKEREEREPKAAPALERKAEREEGRNPEAENEGARLSLWFLFLVSAPILYVLSIGPALLVFTKVFGSAPPGWVEHFFVVFYLPITWLHEHNHAIGKYLEWYLSFFQ